MVGELVLFRLGRTEKCSHREGSLDKAGGTKNRTEQSQKLQQVNQVNLLDGDVGTRGTQKEGGGNDTRLRVRRRRKKKGGKEKNNSLVSFWRHARVGLRPNSRGDKTCSLKKKSDKSP